MESSAVPSLPSCGSIDQTRAVDRRAFDDTGQDHGRPAAIAADLDDRASPGNLGQGPRGCTDQQVSLVVFEPAFDAPHALQNRQRQHHRQRDRGHCA